MSGRTLRRFVFFKLKISFFVFATAYSQVIPFSLWKYSSASQPIAAIGSSSTSQAGNTDIIFSKPAGVTTGSVLYAFIWIDQAGNGSGINTPSGWAVLGSAPLFNCTDNSTCTVFYVFRRVSDGTDGTSYVFNFSTGLPWSQGAVVAYSNVNVTTPEELTPIFTSDCLNSSGTSVSIASRTTLTPGARVLAVYMDIYNATIFGAPSGYSMDFSSLDFGGNQTLSGYGYNMLVPGATGALTTTGWDGSACYGTVSLALKHL